MQRGHPSPAPALLLLVSSRAGDCILGSCCGPWQGPHTKLPLPSALFFLLPPSGQLPSTPGQPTPLLSGAKFPPSMSKALSTIPQSITFPSSMFLSHCPCQPGCQPVVCNTLLGEGSQGHISHWQGTDTGQSHFLPVPAELGHTTCTEQVSGSQAIVPVTASPALGSRPQHRPM